MSFIALQDSEDEVDFVAPTPPAYGFHTIEAPDIPSVCVSWKNHVTWMQLTRSTSQ